MRSAIMISLLLLSTACGQPKQGPTGPAGVAGRNGVDGSSCSVQTSESGSLIQCADGTSSFIANGIAGVKGDQGDVGPTGVDISSIQVVKFCPGETVYPSKFVEIGFCINNKIYATYSANGGFSTEIVPGTYSSNAIGSSCSFRVLTNCGIESL